MAVAASVTVLVLIPLRRRARSLRETPLAHGGRGPRWLVIGSAASLIVLTAAFVLTVIVLDAASRPPSTPLLTIDVIGRQWWWEVRYPGEGSRAAAVTANEIHVPVGRPVRLRLSSVDVIHSFWAPELHGKIDLVPGQTNVFWLQADRPGRYRGQCAEYCGLQHANMGLYVVAEPGDDFGVWLERVSRAAAEPDGDLALRGRELFAVRSGCSLCHTVRGHAEGALGPHPGPDLTHVAGRATLAAATLPNTRENLARWIRNAPSVKPGTQMPEMALGAEDLRALVAYLEQLR